MVTYTNDVGWHAPRIQPYGPLTMSPIASCIQYEDHLLFPFLANKSLSYATQCFEGMKLYRGFDGKLRLFRPDLNAARLAMSSTRVALPSFDTKEFVELLKAFLKIDGPRKSSFLASL